MQLKIGEVFKQLRIAHSITQEKLADYLNVSAQSISKWENGLSYPDITLIPTIALFFNVSTDELFSLSTYTHTQKFTDYKMQYDALK
ncbi:MAG: helix-turn-helix transcriptional regulator, partial [Cellulosilyticum sp.]|nr:helix-turn-helix transcriptional regulator [Cellulosilyticum sp.]MBP3912573.1 helix-turn-helix transcriptional regulator [Niameybacter sp.]